jgi:peptidyl-prolyl cis-trans isomerase D
MFDFVRTHQKLFFFFLVLVIVPSFVLVGVPGLMQGRDSGVGTVATVDGQAIKQVEWDAAFKQQSEQMQRAVPGVDPKFLDTPEMKREALERLMRERVMVTAAQKQGIIVTDGQLSHELMNLPEIKQILGPDGKLDINTYRSFLQARGLTPPQFEASLRQDLTMRTAIEAPAAAVPATTVAARAAVEALLQRREAQWIVFDPKKHVTQVKPSDDDLQAHYKANGESMYSTRERAQIEYVVLDASALKSTQPVNAEEVRKYYDENAARYTQAEERQASHILIKADASEGADKRAAAKGQAEKVLTEVRQSPTQFAALAKKHSQDPGSAAQGGDLGFFGRSQMVKPFEDAAYAMKVGEISQVIETDFGYHIIKLTATKGGEKQSFESVKSAIESDLQLQLAQKDFAKVAEQFGELAYSQSDSLQPLVDRLKLTKQTATVSRGTDPSAKAPLNAPKLIDAVFSNETVKDKRNTPAVETGPSQLTVARIVTHEPVRLQSFDEVKDRVREAVVAKQAADAARAQGVARLAKSKADNDGAGLSASTVLSRVQTQGQSTTLIQAVLAAPTTTLPQWVGVDLGAGGYAVVRINSVSPPPADSPEVAALAPRYQQAWAQAQSQGAYESVRKRYDAKILVK